MSITKYSLIIDTDAYTGNFEREMCAYMTGRVGACEVGDREAEIFEKECSKYGIKGMEDKYFFGEYLETVLDDDGCHRPVNIFNSETAENGHFESLQIHLYDGKLPQELLNIVLERAEEFAKIKGIKIVGRKYLKEVTHSELEEIPV